MSPQTNDRPKNEQIEKREEIEFIKMENKLTNHTDKKYNFSSFLSSQVRYG